MRACLVVLAVAGVALAASPAVADGPTAAELKQQGDEAMRSLHYREALDLYDRAFAESHDPAILYNRARGEQALGDYPAALDAIEQFVRIAPDDLKRRVPKLADLVADIRDHVGLVVVVCSVDGATVRMQGKVVGTTPLPAPVKVPAGPLSIEVEAPSGGAPFHKDVVAPGGKLTTVEAVFPHAAVVVTPPPPPPPPVAVPTERHVPGGWRVATYSIGAIGLAGLALGATFGGLVAAKTGDASGHCPSKVCDPTGWADIADARTFATVSDIAFIAGGVLVGASVVMLIFAPHTTSPVTPVVGFGTVGLRGVF